MRRFWGVGGRGDGEEMEGRRRREKWREMERIMPEMERKLEGRRKMRGVREEEEEEKGREGAWRWCDEPKRVPFPGTRTRRVRRG